MTGNFYFVFGFVAAIFELFFTSNFSRNKERKNIVFIDSPLSPPGGGQISLCQIIENLKTFRPFVLVDKKNDFAFRLEQNGIPYCVLKISKFNFLWIWPKIINIIKIINPAIVHNNGATTFCSFAFALASKILNIPFIWHVRVLEKSRLRDDIIAFLSSKIIVISEEVRNKFRGRWRSKTVKIYNAVDSKNFKPSTEIALRLKKELNISHEEKIIGVFSRLAYWKGHELFLKAAKSLISKGRKVKFLIVGDGEEYYNLIQLSKNLNISDKIIFTGHVENVVNYMTICDIIVNPSVEPEPFGRTIIEGMALGKIIVASNMGGPKEIIESGKDGFLTDADENSLTCTISRILDDFEVISNIGMNALKKANELFNMENQLMRLNKLYAGIMHERDFDEFNRCA